MNEAKGKGSGKGGKGGSGRGGKNGKDGKGGKHEDDSRVIPMQGDREKKRADDASDGKKFMKEHDDTDARAKKPHGRLSPRKRLGCWGRRNSSQRSET